MVCTRGRSFVSGGFSGHRLLHSVAIRSYPPLAPTRASALIIVVVSWKHCTLKSTGQRHNTENKKQSFCTHTVIIVTAACKAAVT